MTVAGDAVPLAPIPWGWLIAFIVALGAQRLSELWLSRRNIERLRRLGAVEHGRAHFPALVALHALFPVALVLEVALLGARPGALWPLWLAAFGAAQLVRYASVAALGDHWNTGIWVVPGEPPIRRGPYRWFRHPNYLAVVVELAAAPLPFGAWRTAIVFSAVNLALLVFARIPAEERALGFRK